MPIHSNHRRALASRLLVLDHTLCDFERWASGEQVESALYRHLDDLTTRQRRAVLREVQAMREQLCELRDQLNLPVQTTSARHRIVSHCAMLWELLLELEPQRLRHYGAVPDELSDYLRPRVDELQRRLERLGRAFRSG